MHNYIVVIIELALITMTFAAGNCTNAHVLALVASPGLVLWSFFFAFKAQNALHIALIVMNVTTAIVVPLAAGGGKQRYDYIVRDSVSQPPDAATQTEQDISC